MNSKIVFFYRYSYEKASAVWELYDIMNLEKPSFIWDMSVLKGVRDR